MHVGKIVVLGCLLVPLGVATTVSVRDATVVGPGTEKGEWAYSTDIGWTGEAPESGNAMADVFWDLSPGQDDPKLGSLSGSWKSDNDGFHLGSLPSGATIRVVVTWSGNNDRATVLKELPPCN